MPSRLAFLGLFAVVATALLAGCGTNHTGVSTTTGTGETTTSTVPARLSVTVYRVEGGKVVPQSVQIDSTSAVAAAALRALALDAPVTIAGGTATVDLANATDAEIAEIVFTLTQFRSIQRVDVAGHTGLTRADEDAYSPAILIDSPAAGATVPRTITVAGTAQVFEATFVLELRRDGKLLERRTVTASEGAPARGTFAGTLSAPSPGPATIVAYAPSAADGSPQHQVEVPVTVTP